MNLPNKLTLLRMCLIPVFLVFMLARGITYNYVIALVVFAAASLTTCWMAVSPASRGW
jgi:CDP-diacylglycerol--glycerol-3-phosphate 3-phosphatidyltransferase